MGNSKRKGIDNGGTYIKRIKKTAAFLVVIALCAVSFCGCQSLDSDKNGKNAKDGTEKNLKDGETLPDAPEISGFVISFYDYTNGSGTEYLKVDILNDSGDDLEGVVLKLSFSDAYGQELFTLDAGLYTSFYYGQTYGVYLKKDGEKQEVLAEVTAVKVTEIGYNYQPLRGAFLVL
ncbi:MAG: hypothetical protein LBT30_03030 [Clostridiales bacterium]|nr:hypothetical protein [Clostridiales bacterium]